MENTKVVLTRIADSRNNSGRSILIAQTLLSLVNESSEIDKHQIGALVGLVDIFERQVNTDGPKLREIVLPIATWLNTCH